MPEPRKTLRNVRGAWIKDQHVRCDSGKIFELNKDQLSAFAATPDAAAS